MLSRFEKMTLLSSANDHLKALEGLKNRVERLSLFAQLDTVLEQLTGDGNNVSDGNDTGSKTRFGFPSLPASEKLHATFPPWVSNFKQQRYGAEPVYVNKRLGYAVILQLSTLSPAKRVQESDLHLIFSPERYKGFDGVLWPLVQTVEKVRTGQIVLSKDKASIRSAANTVLAKLNKVFPMHLSDSQISINNGEYKVEYAGLKYPIDTKNLSDAVAFAFAKYDDSEVNLVKVMQNRAKQISFKEGWDVSLEISDDPLVAKKFIDGRQVSVTFDNKVGSTVLHGLYSVDVDVDGEALYNGDIDEPFLSNEMNEFIENMDTFVTELIAKQTIH